MAARADGDYHVAPRRKSASKCEQRDDGRSGIVAAFDVVSGIDGRCRRRNRFLLATKGKDEIVLPFLLPRPVTGTHTLVSRDGACLRRILVIIARREA